MWNLLTYSENVAFFMENGQRITYRELNKLQKMYSDCMKVKRELVLVVCSLCIESIIIYIACIQSRVPVMMVDCNLSEEKLNSLIEDYKPKYIWNLDNNMNLKDYRLERSFDKYRFYSIEREGILVNENLALLLLTSGTTGSKKSVRISYENIKENMEAIVKVLELSHKDVAAMMLPLCYSYGLSVLNSNLSVGATLLVPESKIYSKDFWDFFCDFQGTSICGVPYTYEILKKLKFHNKVLPSLRLMTQAGGALGIDEQKYFLEYANKNNCEFAVMYGQTEATARISSFFLNRNVSKLGSVGKSISGKIEIRDRGTDGSGEIVYIGKNVTMGYAISYEDLLMNDENKGVLYTGDIGYLDDDGYLYITGRKNRIAKPQGVRISLDEIQRKISDKAGEQIICMDGNRKIYICVEKKYNCNKITDIIMDLDMDYRIFEIIYIKKFLER